MDASMEEHLPTLAERRVKAIVTAAADRRTGVAVGDLTDLMPAEGPDSDLEVVQWIRARPPLASVVGDIVVASGQDSLLPSSRERRARGAAYLNAAQAFVVRDLGPVRGFVECVGVTGSTAYGEPEEGDDCDFLAITRPGSVWAFLTFLYLKLRLRTPRDPSQEPPVWCFNYVLDARAVRRDFARPRGFLFAREALSTRVLQGDKFYRALLASAPWLGEEAPRLFARWGMEEPIEPVPVTPSAPLALRLANLLLYPIIASYLQLQGLRRNHRLRQEGAFDECFRTLTYPDRLMVMSRKFDRFEELYAPATRVTPEE